MSTTVLFDAPGPKGRARHRIISGAFALITLAVTVFALTKLGQKGNLDADKWTPFLTTSMWADYLLPGLMNTLKAASISILLSAAFGLVFGIGRASRHRPIRLFCALVVEFFRAIPVLVIMISAFSIYSYNGIFASDLNPLAAVITGVTLFNGSAIAELLRSGIRNLPAGQSEAGLAVGLSAGQAFRAIQLPQAITAMLPSLIGQFVIVLKDTTLGQIITYPELLNTYQQIGSNWSNIVPAIIVIAAIFICINFTLTTLMARLDRRLRRTRRARVAAPELLDA